MKSLFLSFILIILVSGCTTAPYFVSGGNRAGGTITMNCNYSIAEACSMGVTTEMMHEAAEACDRWGYESAIPFGGIKRIPYNEYQGRVEVDFQCMGDLEL